ncbi:MAG: 5-methyltetrahydrofolate--homocysteine methyltransferase [Ruminococcus sp.]|nr:5-methyltetrahydrofolate--homocysteine methyltransferase [Ruminococcus sp.]
MINKTEVHFSELNINKAEALRYAGVKGNADENTLNLFNKAFELLSQCVKPKAVYKCFSVSYTDSGVIIDNEEIKSLGLKKFLKGADRCAIMAATAGIEADRLISRYSMVEPSLALMIDAISAAAVEALCNKLCKGCFEVDKQRRFSPGYSDFPIDYQKRIVSLLSTQLNIGVTLTSSLMLVPSKSVTAVIPLKGCNSYDN